MAAITAAVPPVPFSLHPVSLPQQKTFESRPFPLVLSPSPSTSSSSSPSPPSSASSPSPSNGHHHPADSDGPPAGVGRAAWDFAAWFATQRDEIERQLREHSAIFFRGLPLRSASDFNAVVEAYGREELPYVGGAAPRTNVVGRVFTSNESPPDQKIPFHHEMAQVPNFPARLFFFCEVPPSEGGETPLLLSHLLTQQLQQRRPGFVEQLRTKGLRYVRVLGEGDDTSSAIGRGWQSTFLTTDKAEAEKRGKQLGVSLQWLPDGSVRTVSGVLPALRLDESSGREAWFNSMVAAFTGWRDSRNDPTKAVTFGDGSPLPAEAVEETQRVMTEIEVAIPWQAGDLLLVDNHTVQHSRRSFVPPRRVLASLTK